MPLSICILTFKRPAWLRKCVESCLNSEYRPIEIVVSDDDYMSGDAASALDFQFPDGVTLNHVEGPSISQSRNARNAFENASSAWCLLLHDDDFLLPGAIDKLMLVLRRFPTATAVYGKHVIVGEDGEPDWAKTEEVAAAYQKNVPDGPQYSPLWCALTQQFPNNGMVINRDLALRAKFPTEEEVGRVPVDFHFGINYALVAGGNFVLIQEYTCAYRVHSTSVSDRGRREAKLRGHLGYERLKTIEPNNAKERAALSAALRRYSSAAITGYLGAGRPLKALITNVAHFHDSNASLRARVVWLVISLLECFKVPAAKIYFDK